MGHSVPASMPVVVQEPLDVWLELAAPEQLRWRVVVAWDRLAVRPEVAAPEAAGRVRPEVAPPERLAARQEVAAPEQLAVRPEVVVVTAVLDEVLDKVLIEVLGEVLGCRQVILGEVLGCRQVVLGKVLGCRQEMPAQENEPCASGERGRGRWGQRRR